MQQRCGADDGLQAAAHEMRCCIKAAMQHTVVMCSCM